MVGTSLLIAILLSGWSGEKSTPIPSPLPAQVAAPAIATRPAQGGAVIVSLIVSSPSAVTGAKIYYTLDGSKPTAYSTQYLAPFLVAANSTVKTVAILPGGKDSAITSQNFAPNIPSGTLVWSDEFSTHTAINQPPDASIWTYDTGNSGFGNQELETYCAAASSTAPCTPASPNAYVGTDGLLHIIARNPSKSVYTSARLKTEGLFSFQYGHVEARMKLPESQGMWPAFWLLGSNIATLGWPVSGELDVMEHISGSNPANEGFDWVQGSVHGPEGLNGGTQYHPTGFSAAEWHTYGMVWTKEKIEYYVDDPANIYASFASRELKGKWPFNDGPQFLLLNLAVGGNWPGNPDATTVFPSELLVDYVRLYAN